MERKQIFHNGEGKNYGLSFIEGSLAGLIATVPMTIFMLAVQYLLPKRQQYALPPERFTEKFARRVGLKKHMGKRQLLVASFVSHLGFGGAMGAIYGPLTRVVPFPSVLKGCVFGVVVWLTAYLGWLPVVGMSEAATRQPIQRNVLMITAHIVWGSVMGGVMRLLEGAFDRLIDGYRLKKVS